MNTCQALQRMMGLDGLAFYKKIAPLFAGYTDEQVQMLNPVDFQVPDMIQLAKSHEDDDTDEDLQGQDESDEQDQSPDEQQSPVVRPDAERCMWGVLQAETTWVCDVRTVNPVDIPDALVKSWHEDLEQNPYNAPPEPKPQNVSALVTQYEQGLTSSQPVVPPQPFHYVHWWDVDEDKAPGREGDLHWYDEWYAPQYLRNQHKSCGWVAAESLLYGPIPERYWSATSRARQSRKILNRHKNNLLALLRQVQHEQHHGLAQ